MGKQIVGFLAGVLLGVGLPMACSTESESPVTGVPGETTQQGVDGGGVVQPDANVAPGADVGPSAGLDAAELPDAQAVAGDDAGLDSGEDAGDDAGADAGEDAGGDAGRDAGKPPIQFPATTGWQFYGPQDGVPDVVYGATYDEGGNLWVAGGELGLYVMRANSTTFERFTMADGLRPYGYMPDGSAPPGTPFLKVITVEGGPAGTVFVGYEGKPPGPGQLNCESNWDGPSPDPSIYKSGDADRVTLNAAGGIDVVHYDIFSGPGEVKDELRGREKLCNIVHIVWDKGSNSLWFGANHGFAWGNPSFAGAPTCNGQRACEGVKEHVHPAINAWADDAKSYMVFLTGYYYGVAVDPVTQDVWFGGSTRSTKFRYGSNGFNFWTAQSLTEQKANSWNRFDLWPDQVSEPTAPTPSQRKDDSVSSAAALSDGTVWMGSYYYGLAHLDKDGLVTGYLTRADGLVDDHVWSLETDPSDGSVWVGGAWGGLTRIKGGTLMPYDYKVFGQTIITSPAVDIQAELVGGQRRLVVSFGGKATKPNGIGVYTGP